MSQITRYTRTDAPPKRLSTTVAPPSLEQTISAEQSAESRRRRRKATAFLALLIGVAVFDGSRRVPVGPSSGSLDVRIVAAAVAPDRPARLKLGTYNIHGGTGTDGRLDLPRIADVLRGLDFVGLNEVYGPTLWESADQAATLAQELNMTSLFAPTEQRWWHLRFGNAVLARLDVTSWQVVPLARNHGKSFRNLTHVRARAANGVPVNIVVTHIDRSDDRERHDQLRAAGDYFLSLAQPAVLMGDLNSDAADKEIQRLLATPGVVDALGHVKGLNSPRHIDWLFVRGLKVIDSGLTPPGPSDHGHLWADLEVPPVATPLETDHATH